MLVSDLRKVSINLKITEFEKMLAFLALLRGARVLVASYKISKTEKDP
jgi:hypothetical protein